MNQKPVPYLEWSSGMARAAQDMASYQGAKGERGHIGANGSHSWDRLAMYGKYIGTIGEGISYTYDNGWEALIQLIVDDGVPTRGHRISVFKKDYHVCGVGAARHIKFNHILVIDYAEKYLNKQDRDGATKDGSNPKAPDITCSNYKMNNAAGTVSGHCGNSFDNTYCSSMSAQYCNVLGKCGNSEEDRTSRRGTYFDYLEIPAVCRGKRRLSDLKQLMKSMDDN